MSIKVEDLRVGNYLTRYGEKVKLVEIGIKHNNDTNYYLRCENDHCGFWIDQYKPIPLTDKDVKQYGHFNLIKVNDEYFVCFGNYKTQVKFLHELQNYYYLVNHEEL